MGKQEQEMETQAEAIERYRKLQVDGHHTLPYKEFPRAEVMGRVRLATVGRRTR